MLPKRLLVIILETFALQVLMVTASTFLFDQTEVAQDVAIENGSNLHV